MRVDRCLRQSTEVDEMSVWTFVDALDVVIVILKIRLAT